MELNILIRRPSAETRLGIRLISEQAEQAPFVTMLNPSGVAAGSALRIGDQILLVDGQKTANSEAAVALFAQAGNEVRLRVRRAPRTITIARNKLGLGLSVDSTNRVTALYEGSSAAEHGGIAIGDRVIAVNGQPLSAENPLAPRIPSGAAPFQLTLLAVGDGEAEHGAGGLGGVGGVGGVGGGGSRAAPNAFDDSGAGVGLDRGGRGAGAMTSIGGGTRQSISQSPLASVAGFTRTQLFELQSAFIILSGTSDTAARIRPPAVLAAVTHFERDATLEDVEGLCAVVGGRRDGAVDLHGFCLVMLEVRKRLGAAHAIFDTIDAHGVGCATQTDAAKLVKALATNTSLGIVPTEDDVATMLAMLRPGRDGLVHRRPSLAALQQALAAAAGPRRPDSFGGTPSSAPGSPTTGASRSSSEAAPVVRVMR